MKQSKCYAMCVSEASNISIYRTGPDKCIELHIHLANVELTHIFASLSSRVHFTVSFCGVKSV